MKKEEFIAKRGVKAYERYLAKCREYNKQHKQEKAEYRKQHKEEITEKKKQYYQKHKKEIIENRKQYYQTNREKIAENSKQYYQTHREEFIEKVKQYYGTPMGRARNLLRAYNQADIKQNRGKGDLTTEWIIENIFNKGKCHYCGRELPFTELGCDRMDSNLPHTKDNCVPCCESCNKKKHTTSYDEYTKKQVSV